MNSLCWSLATAGVELQRALDACESAVSQRPKDASVLDSRGFVLLRLGRFDEAIASYDEALKLRATLAVSLYGRGLAKRRKGDRRGADADLRSAITLDAHVAIAFADYGLRP